MVERAHALTKPAGMVGLLVPSGLAADLGASRFFREISTGARLAALFDFENKKVFFPDIDTRFKFAVYIAGGPQRTFEKTDCAFYLHDVDDLGDANRRFSLTAQDFASVNPNTGTAPVFRTRRDAELTTAIYARVPVLVDRRATPRKLVWPIRQLTMFHMTNDAEHFRTQQQLWVGGFYPVDGGHWRRGEEECVPLFEGKMVQAFDHRAASISVNPTTSIAQRNLSRRQPNSTPMPRGNLRRSTGRHGEQSKPCSRPRNRTRMTTKRRQRHQGGFWASRM